MASKWRTFDTRIEKKGTRQFSRESDFWLISILWYGGYRTACYSSQSERPIRLDTGPGKK